MPNDVASAAPEATSPAAAFPLPYDLLEISRTLQQRIESAEPLPEVASAQVATGEAAWLTAKSPVKATPNEDALLTLSLDGNGGLLAVADGLGGHRDGRGASQMIRSALTRAARKINAGPPDSKLLVSKCVPVPTTLPAGPPLDSRTVWLDEIERVNQRLLRAKSGSATTLAMVEIAGRRVRSYHVGDSEVLIVSQRGRVKFSTVSHSPVGYAVEAGLLTEEEALLHPDRHLVSNVVGSDSMSVQLGPWITLAPRDTVLLASDGLFDNLMQAEIVELLRKGPLTTAVRQLAEQSRERMLLPFPDHPSKPDDLTILAYRSRSRQRA